MNVNITPPEKIIDVSATDKTVEITNDVILASDVIILGEQVKSGDADVKVYFQCSSDSPWFLLDSSSISNDSKSVYLTNLGFYKLKVEATGVTGDLRVWIWGILNKVSL